jgi:hypothetical protein
MRVQKHNNKRFTKKMCRKVFTKKSEKTQNRLFLDFVLSRFWAFLGEGSSKTRPKYRKKTDLPWRFFSPRGTNQPRQGPSLCF